MELAVTIISILGALLVLGFGGWIKYIARNVENTKSRIESCHQGIKRDLQHIESRVHAIEVDLMREVVLHKDLGEFKSEVKQDIRDFKNVIIASLESTNNKLDQLHKEIVQLIKENR